MASKVLGITAALAAAATLAACGGSTPFSAGPPGASGPAITLQDAELGLERAGIDLQQDRGVADTGGLSYMPVQSMRYGSADSGAFELLVFNTARTAKAALPSVRKTDEASDGALVTITRNVIAVVPKRGLSGQTRAVPRLLQNLPTPESTAGQTQRARSGGGQLGTTDNQTTGSGTGSNGDNSTNETAGPAG